MPEFNLPIIRQIQDALVEVKPLIDVGDRRIPADSVKKVNEITDDGGWFANSSDKEFNSANCDKPKDYVITNSGPIASFRADNIAFEFKNLSIREIQPV